MTDSLGARRRAFLDALFKEYRGPAFAIRLWEGGPWFSSPAAAPACTLVLADPKALVALLATPNELTLGEAFIRGGLDVQGDLFSAFAVAEYLFDRPRRLRQLVTDRLAATLFGLGQWLRHGARNSRRRDGASIAYHYDQPVDFYLPWLGDSLVYSCAYFHHPDQPLDQAQEQKLELVCQKLRLQPGERFLDIGCGWGSLVLHAGKEHRAQSHGVTLSRQQAEMTRRRIRSAGLEQCCSVDLCDYRDLPRAMAGTGQFFDKIASIGMFEHVGLRNLPLYFGIARSLLRPGGVLLNHGIARSPTAAVRERSFIDRYVFPDGRLVTLSQALSAAEGEGLEVRDVENLREHYHLTLRHWVAGLKENAPALRRFVSETTYRIWLLYTAGCAAAFRRGDIGVYQVLLSRPDGGDAKLPLTREDWYAAHPTGVAV